MDMASQFVTSFEKILRPSMTSTLLEATANTYNELEEDNFGRALQQMKSILNMSAPFELTLSEDSVVDDPAFECLQLKLSVCQKREELSKLENRVYQQQLFKEVEDIIDPRIIEGRLSHIKDLKTNSQFCTNNKKRIIEKFQQPELSFLVLHERYHKYAAEIFPMMASIFQDHKKCLNDLKWTKETECDFVDESTLPIIVKKTRQLQTLKNSIEAFHTYSLHSDKTKV